MKKQDFVCRSIPHRYAAFTLVEVALAILAIGLGLLGIFGLGHYGMETSRENQNDNRCDIFADAVFSSLRTYNDYFSNLSRSNTVNAANHWMQLWAQAINNNEIPFPPISGINTNVGNLVFNKTFPAFDKNNISLLEWNPYYELGALTNAYSSVARGYNYFSIVLRILPDGNTYSSEPRTYTTSFVFTGGQP